VFGIVLDGTLMELTALTGPEAFGYRIVLLKLDASPT
jgi:hypothetical protein